MSSVLLGAGTDLEIGGPSGITVPTGPMRSYSASQCTVSACTATQMIDLTADLVNLQLTGTVNVTETERVTSPTGPLGRTADVDACGHGISMNVRNSTNVRSLAALDSFYLVIERKDANRVHVVPINLSSVNKGAPAAGVQTVTFGGTQDASNFAVEGARVTSGALSVAATTTTYLITTTGISALTSAGTVAANQIGVVGTRIVASNAALSGETLYKITGISTGVDNLAYNDARNPTPIPGSRGVTASQPNRFRTYVLPFIADSNSFHDQLLRHAHGQRRKWEWRDLTDTGQPEQSGDGIMRTTLTINMPTDRVTWGCEIQIDGTPMETTQ